MHSLTSTAVCQTAAFISALRGEANHAHLGLLAHISPTHSICRIYIYWSSTDRWLMPRFVLEMQKVKIAQNLQGLSKGLKG